MVSDVDTLEPNSAQTKPVTPCYLFLCAHLCVHIAVIPERTAAAGRPASAALSQKALDIGS